MTEEKLPDVLRIVKNYGVIANMANMKRANDLGSTGERVAANVARLRKVRSLGQQDTADRMTELGRPMRMSAISKIEKGERRVDADDLVALAVVLDVAPAALLLPAEPADMVDVTCARQAGWQAAWRWANGEQPLIRPGEVLETADRRVGEFIRTCRPYEGPRPIDEVARYLIAREHPPFRAEIVHDGVRTRARLIYGDGDL